MAKVGRALFVTGVSELDAKLKRMSFRIQGRILRNAMRKAMEPVLQQAKETIPVAEVDGGYTKSRLRIKHGKPHRDGTRTVRVGIFGPARHGRGKRKREVPTGKIIEFGKEGSGGKMILRRALSSKESTVHAVLRSELQSAVRAAVL